MFLVGEPCSSPGVGELGWEAGLREALRVKRDVDRVVVYFVLPVAEYMGRAPQCGCIGVSVRRRKSGECVSIMVTTSVREGLSAPAFWALIVRNFKPTPWWGGASGI